LTLIFTTRSSRKGSDTLSTLQTHVNSTAQHASRRIQFRSETLELTHLHSVKALALRLLASDVPRLDAIILNAGIGGWTGIDWPLLTWRMIIDIRRATTWPTSKLGAVGLITKPQMPPIDGQKIEEPVLGEVFCANVFGHYMLTHWLMPLFWACPAESPGKVLWVGSVEASSRHYKPVDHQGLRSSSAYEQTKRIMDYMAITSNLPATEQSMETYTRPETFKGCSNRPQNSRPTVHVTHPGILTTTIIELYWIIQHAYLLGIYIVRWLGSPWATVNPYPAAISAVWLALLGRDQLHIEEAKQGGLAIKWGSAIDRLGRSRVETTDVPGWGYNGSGKPFADTWWGGPSWWNGGNIGRDAGSKDATKEDVDNFIAEGADVWQKMEVMRTEWEERLQAYEKLHK
jgi:3-keto steroid reductase